MVERKPGREAVAIDTYKAIPSKGLMPNHK
jgi:hypothetical protein